MAPNRRAEPRPPSPSSCAPSDDEGSVIQEADGAARDVAAAKNSLRFPYLSHAIDQMDDGTPAGLGLKRSFELMDPAKAALLEAEAKAVAIKRMKHELKKMKLIHESAKLLVDSLAAME